MGFAAWLLFGIDHFLRDAAIDRDALPVDKIALRVAQKQTRASYILGSSYAPREVKRMILGAELLLLLDVDPTRSDAVYGDVIGRKRYGQRMGERPDTPFRGGIGLGAGLALQIAGRAEVYDTALGIRCSHLLAVHGEQP